MNQPSIIAAILTGAAAWTAHGQPGRAVVSRFSDSAEGWTLEGPGQLTWMPGGFLEVVRTGSGELYIVAPAAFHGEWGPQQQFVDPRVSLNLFLPTTAGSDRPPEAELSGPAGTATGATTWPSLGMMPTPSPSALEANTLSLTSVIATTWPATGAVTTRVATSVAAPPAAAGAAAPAATAAGWWSAAASC